MAKKNLFKKIASVAMAGALTLSMALLPFFMKML